MSADWYVTEAAVESWIFMQRYPDDDTHFDRADDELAKLVGLLDPVATLRETDGQGRQLHRTGRMHRHSLPSKTWLVVDPRSRKGGRLPALIWAGQGRPPAWAWGDE